MNLRSFLYLAAKAMGDAKAISKGPEAIVKRTERRLLGRLASRIINKLVK